MGNPAKAKRGIPSKVDDFNAWYPFIVEAADLVDKRYPITVSYTHLTLPTKA